MLERRKLQRLPLSYADFRTIREGNYKYIDKTEYIYNLVEQGGMFFLARPRRFGKSLTLRTIQALYQGSENLFEGLWIHDYWDFTKIHPVFHLSMKSVEFKECDLLTGLTHELDSIAKNEGIVCTQKTMPRRFAEILQALSKRAKVVVLIDEYDAPIMEFLGADTQKARENRDVLRTFYTVLKENDTLLEFVMLTGITKFTKVGVFSGLNNLTDISMSEEYAGMLGYTQTELEANFQEYIQAVGDRRSLSYQEMLEKMKFWYNGYRFNVECPTMYNPVSLHLLFFNKEFNNFWFETGTPTGLIQHLLQERLYRFELKMINKSEFSTFDIDAINTYSLLLQTGYLTLGSKNDFDEYQLIYPNYEVEKSMVGHLLTAFSGLEPGSGPSWASRAERAFLENDIALVISILQTVFKNIPYHLHEKRSEAFYHASVHLLFTYMGVKVQSESATNDGRSDALLTTPTHIYIIEFKLDKTPAIAFKQIYNKEYAKAHAHQGKPVIGIGINFSSETKNIDGYCMAELYGA